MEPQFNFDKIISRSGSDSVKWKRYPEDVLPLWVADMDFPSPPEVVEALKARSSHPFYGYGCEDEELLETICKWAISRHGWKIEPDWLLLVPGVVSGMNWAIQSTAGAGQRLAFMTPVYPPFFKFAGCAGLEVDTIPMIDTRGGYQIDFDRFNQTIQGSSVFALCNPHNPVGRVFSRPELEQIASACLEKGAIICSDEIHCDLVYKGSRHVPIASISKEIAEAAITLMAPSKTFNIPGLEFSFAVVPNADLRKQMEYSRRGLLGHPNILAFAAAKAAYANGAEWLEELMFYLQGNRDYLKQFIDENLPGIQFHLPEGTYLAWLDCRELVLRVDPYSFFLQEARVGLNKGRDFGQDGGGFVRLNFAAPRQILAEALERMKRALESSKER